MSNQEKVKADKWLKISVNKKTLKKISRGRHNLSRHVLNLRSVSPKPEMPINKVVSRPVAKVTKFKVRINLLNPTASLFYIPWWRVERRFPVTRGLTINFALELIYRSVFYFFKFVLRFYYRIYVYSRAILREVIQDVANLLDLIVSVVTFASTSNKRQTTFVSIPRLSQLMFFIFLSLALVTPIKWLEIKTSLASHKNQIVSYAQAAMDQFSLASERLFIADYEQAFSDFNAANISLAKAQLKIDQINEDLAGLVYRLPVISNKVQSVQKIIEAARLLADSGETITTTLSNIAPVKDLSQVNLGSNIEHFRITVNNIIPKLEKAAGLLQSADLAKVDSLMISSDWVAINQRMTDLVGIFKQTANVLGVMREMIPEHGDRRYLLVFQNYSELRPTGGFMGSLAFLEFSDGKLTIIDVPAGGPYDFQGQLQLKINPPQPLTLINSLWQLQDANWYFDFPSSANKINWFLENSGVDKVDGVVAINPDVVIDLLNLTGPINLPTYHKIISADNFLRETQEAVELEYDRQINRPKQFIADLMPLLLDRLLSLRSADQLKILGQVVESLNIKSIQVYFDNRNLQNMALELGWAGEVKPGYFDYLAIVRTNIGGGKSDLVTYDTVKQLIDISATGEVMEKVSLERDHRGDPFDIFYKRHNISWTKFYVPLGSQLISASGFSDMSNYVFKNSHSNSINDTDLEKTQVIILAQNLQGVTISQEFGKTVFSGWLDVAPGEKKSVVVEYKLPNALPKLLDGDSDLWHYDSYYQQQSGVRPLDFSSVVKFPNDLVPRWQESSGKVVLGAKTLTFTSDWDNDEYLGVILGRMLAD